MKKIFLFLAMGILMMGFSSADLTDDIINYYNLDASTATDSLAKLTLTKNGGIVTDVAGIIDKSFDFDGSTGFLSGMNGNILNTTGFSINMWIRNTGSDTSMEFFGDQNGGNVFGISYGVNCGAGDFGVFDEGVNSCHTTSFNNVDWYMLTTTYNGTEVKIYINGTSVGNATGTINGAGLFPTFAKRNTLNDSFFDGEMDEIGIWADELTTDEIAELYNSGAGRTYPFSDTLVLVDLNAPSNDSTVSSNVTFNATLTPPPLFNLTNATLFVWDSDGDIFFTGTNIVTGNSSNLTSFEVSNLTSGDYEWNVLGFVDNSTGFTLSNFSDFNNTFSWIPFDVNNEGFETDVFETSRQEFLLNITTIPSILSVDAILNYEGTRFTAQTSCLGGFCEIETAIDIPLVDIGESENKSFFWEITVFDGTVSFTSNTGLNDQNVTRLHLEQCNATFATQALNFTAFNEATLAPVDPFIFGGSFDFWTGTGTVKRNNSIANQSASSVQLCLSPTDQTLRLDGTIDYDEAVGTNFTSRNYFFGNNTISNISQDIALGLLNADDSTSFILKVQNRDILPQPNVLISTQRFYPGEGIFRTVQVSKTDDSGATVGFFKTETVEYRFVLTLNGDIVLVTNKQKIVGEEVPFTLTFTIGEGQDAAWEGFEDVDDLDSGILFNKSTSVVSFTYLDTSGDFSSSRFIVEKINASALQNDVVCDVISIQSSATLTCNLTGNITGQYTSRGIITRNGESFLADQLTFVIENFSQIAGDLGLFLGWFVILICAFLFKFNEIAGIIMINLSVIFVNLIGLIAFGYVFISAMLAISIIILVVLER